MTHDEMIEKFVCPGCVGGYNTKCGQYAPLRDSGILCEAHVLGTSALGTGNFALGLPKGFNRPGYRYGEEAAAQFINKMMIRCFVAEEDPEWDNLNVPVWALEQDGFLFVRTYMPRINMSFVDVIEGGYLSMVPNAINVAEFWDEID